MKDSPSTISDVARALDVSVERAAEIISVIDAARAGGTITPSIAQGRVGNDGAAETIAVPLYEEEDEAASVPDLSPAPDEDGLGGGDTWTGSQQALPIASRYEQLEEIGRGGVGQVFLVRDRHFDRLLALKVMRQDAAAAGLAPTLFLREARVEARLQHPGIPPVYDRGELPDGRPWYTMKRVEGSSLTATIRRLHGPGDVDLRGVIRQFEQVCRTVAYAHEQGVVHRDLKPDNIMVGDLGEVLVLDWGLAVVLGEDQRTTGSVAIVGTPAYMSPEQARGDLSSLEPGTDVYALGAVLYHILTGRPPYTGRTAREVVTEVRTRPPAAIPPDPEGVPGQRPRALVDLCHAAMARVAHARPETARVVADVVRAWLDHAERQDRGLEEIDRAASIGRALSALAARRRQAWADAARLLDGGSEQTAAARQRWRQAWALREELSVTRERERSALRAALAHSPGLLDAHLPLARHHGELAQRNAVLADAVGQQREEAIARRHLAALPAEHRSRLEAELASLNSDPLWRETVRRGPLVGRDSMLAALTRRLEGGARLTVLHGGPGVGKSALLVALGTALHSGARRVVFERVAQATDVGSLSLAVCSALAPDASGGLTESVLSEALRREPQVLLLDGLDRCAGDVGRLLGSWLEGAPDLQIVLTSRRIPDGIDTTAVRVPPLERLAALELFVETAVRTVPSLDVGELDLDLLLGLVDSLERLPLAIELAASRVGALPLMELRDRLDATLDLLGAGVGTGGSLDVAMELSWDCLGPSSRDALLQLSIFESTFDRPAAEAVVVLDGGVGATLDAIDDLASQGLLRQEQGPDGSLYLGLTRAVRHWATGRLAGEDGGVLEAVRRRHAEHLAARYASYSADVGVLSELARVLHDLVAAVEEGPPEFVSSCMRPIVRLLTARGPVERGVTLTRAVLDRTDLDPGTRRGLLVSLAECLRAAGRHGEASAVLGRAESLHGRGEDDPEAGGTSRDRLDHLVAQARVAFEQGDAEAAGRGYQAALRIARLLDDVSAMVRCHMGLGLLAEPDTALPHFSRARRLARKRGTPSLEWDVVANQALAFARAGRTDAAIAAFREAEQGQTETGNHSSAAIAALNLGQMLIRQGELDRAEAALRRALASGRKADSVRVMSAGKAILAGLMLRRGEYLEAASLAALAYASQRERGDRAQANRTCRILTAISIDSGDPAGASRHLKTLLQNDQIEPSEARLARIHEAEVLVMNSESDAARARLEAVVEEARRFEDGRAGALACVALGEIHELRGDVDSAARAFEEAMQFMGPRRGSADPLHGVALSGVAVAEARRGDFDSARAHIAEARSLVEGWAIEHVRCQIRAGFVALEQGDAVGVVQALQETRRRLSSMSIGVQALSFRLFERLQQEFAARPSRAMERIGEKEVAGPERIRRLAELAITAWQGGDLEAAEDRLREGEALMEAVDDPSARSWIRYLRMVFLRERGALGPAEVVGREALQLSRDADDPDRELQILLQLGTALRQRGKHEAAHGCLVEAQALAARRGDGRSEALVLAGFAHLDFDEERFDGAIRGFAAARDQLRELGQPRIALLTEINVAEACLRLGRVRPAETTLSKVLQEGLGTSGSLGTVVNSLQAVLLAASGRPADALRELEVLVQDITLEPYEAAVMRLRTVEVALLAGDESAARHHLAAAGVLIEGMSLLETSGPVRRYRGFESRLAGSGVPEADA